MPSRAFVLGVSLGLCALTHVLLPGALLAADEEAAPEPAATVVDRFLALPEVDVRGRHPFNPDTVLRRYLLDLDAAPPAKGDTVTGTRGSTATWTSLDLSTADAEPPFRAATAYARVERDADTVVLADLQGGSTLYVNGDAYVGDGYGYQFDGVPVPLRRGANHVFVSGLRGTFRLTLRPVSAPVLIGTWDATLPHLVRGVELAQPAALPIVNTTGAPLPDVTIDVLPSGGFAATSTATGVTVPACASTKLAFDLVHDGARDAGGDTVPLTVVVRSGGREVARATLEVTVRAPGDAHLRTFRSEVDGSAQQFGVRPATSPGEATLLLTLHGASVRPMAQVNAYASKADLVVVAPTNRRPFGFDWQDWGRRDAYEALDAALALTGIAPERVVLTGHSMGGHGAWHLAANDPDRFAAVAPSAGWISFDTRTLALGDGGVLAAGWFDAAWALDSRGHLTFGGRRVK